MDNPNNKPLLKKFITETKNQLKTIENKWQKIFIPNAKPNRAICSLVLILITLQFSLKKILQTPAFTPI